MVIPWDLLGTGVAAVLIAGLWAARRAREAGAPRSAPGDLAAGIALAALVAARLVAVAMDAALTGVLPGVRSLLTLGAGLSTPGAVLGALAAGWWALRRAKVVEATWGAALPAAALGLAVWSALALVRGDVGGVVAPFPLGWPLPGEAEPRVPVALFEAVVYGVAALALARSARVSALSLPRRAGLLASTVAAVHLLGSVARPVPPTADADIDALLGLAALVVSLLVTAGARKRIVAGTAGTASVAAVGLIAVAALGGGGAADVVAPAEGSVAPGLEHAIVAGPAPDGPPPRWGPDELAAFLAHADDRPVVVNFWASWCPPCHAEAPAVARTAAAYGDDVAFLGVVVNDDPRRAAEFAQRYNLPFPSVDDAGLRRLLGAAGLPTTVVLHPDGTVASRTVGGLDARGLAAAIDRALPRPSTTRGNSEVRRGVAGLPPAWRGTDPLEQRVACRSWP